VYTREDSTCPIWPGFHAKEVADNPPPDYRVYVIESWRAGGDYSIMHGAERFIQRKDYPYDEQVRARLTTILINKREAGEEWPLVTQKLIEEAASTANLTLEVRADRLLQYMRTTINADLLPVPLDKPNVAHAALAHSESTVGDELDQLLKYLAKQGWIELPSANSKGYRPVITVAGNQRIKVLVDPDRRQIGLDTT